MLCRIFKKNGTITSPTSMEAHQSQIIPRLDQKGCDDRGYFNAGNSMSISQMANSSSLDGMMTTNGTMFSGKEWGSDDQDNYNPAGCSNNQASNHDKNISFISLLNQQYSQTYHQNSNVNPQDTGILHQSYQLPDSHFHNFN